MHRGSDTGMHLYLHVWLLRPRNLVHAPRKLLPVVRSGDRQRDAQGALGAHYPLHLLRRAPPRLYCQRSQGSTQQESALFTFTQGVDSARHLRHVHHGVAGLALFKFAQRQPPRLVLSDHVARLWQDDDEDYPRALDAPAVSLLDGYARANDWWCPDY